MRWYTLTAMIFVLVTYIIVGGIIFSYIETPNETVVATDVQADVATFLAQYPCMNTADLATISQLLTEMKYGGVTISADSTQLLNVTRWDIRATIFIALQLIATIGFPALAPVSDGGRAFTVPFAIFGIPLFLVAAIGMGELLNRLAESLRLALTSRCKSCAPDCGAKVFRTIVITVSGVFFFMIIPSIIFTQIEPWTYAQSLYFTFITLTTIGFGDLIPSYNNVPWMTEDYRNWYRLALAFWILLLSAWFAGVLVSIQTTVTEAARKAEDKLIEHHQGISSNDVATNVRFPLKKELKIKNQRPENFQSLQTSTQYQISNGSPQYEVDNIIPEYHISHNDQSYQISGDISRYQIGLSNNIPSYSIAPTSPAVTSVLPQGDVTRILVR